MKRLLLVLLWCCACSDRSARPGDEMPSVPPAAAPAATRLQTFASRLGKPVERSIQSLADGYRVAATKTLTLDIAQGSGAMVLGTERGQVRITRHQSFAATLRSDGSALQQADHRSGVDALFFALGPRIEELLHLSTPDSLVEYHFEHPSGIRLTSSGTDAPTLQVATVAGRPLARAVFAKAWDATGQALPISLEIEGSVARVQLPRDASYPVVVDPLWTESSTLSSYRIRHTSTLLADGKVLVAGGGTVGFGQAAVETAEVYDPLWATLESVGSMKQPRSGHTATLLRDGKVLIVGGFGGKGQPLADAELYDPAARSFSPVGPAHRARAIHTATRLADGRVLLLGGIADGGFVPDAVVAEAEIYDPETASFASIGDVPDAIFPHAATLLPDGGVAVLWPHPGSLRVARFEPQNSSFAAYGPEGAYADAAGGYPITDVTLTVDPTSTNVLTVSSAGEARYLAGIETWSAAQNAGFRFHNLTEGAYAPISLLRGRLALLAPMEVFEQVPTQPGEPWGWDGKVPVNLPRNPDQFENFAAIERKFATMTTLADGDLFIAGGVARSSEPHDTTVRLSSRPLEIDTYGLEEAISEGHATALLDDGSVLFTGGYQGGLAAHVWRGGTVEGVDGSTGRAYQQVTLEPAGRLVWQRAEHRALVLTSGRVLIAGGRTEPDTANEELFNPATGSSADLGFRLRARGNGIPVGQDRLLFAGSSGFELVDPSNWSITAIPVQLGCATPSMVRLVSGKVAALAENVLLEVDTSKATVRELATFKSPSCERSQTLLPGGSVLIGDAQDPTALLFEPELQALSPIADSNNYKLKQAGTIYGSNVYWPTSTSFDWRTQSFEDWVALADSPPPSDGTAFDALYTRPTRKPAMPLVTALADGSLLLTRGTATHVTDSFGKTKTLLSWWGQVEEAAPVALDDALSVSPGEEVELTVKFSTTWSENSAGTTAASATNSPVPIWTPAHGGFPVTSVFTRWSANQATWRVPSTPFPGRGFLSYAVSGVRYPLRAVTIRELADGVACSSDSACQSGACVEGSCCDRACDGPCEACTAALKGSGEDGSCGPVEAGALDPLCKLEDATTCGTTGRCDGLGSCAVYPEGEPCASGATCHAGSCTQTTDLPPMCDGEHTVIQGSTQLNCSPFRCKLSDGSCLDECASSADCVEGFTCGAEGKCREAFAPSRRSVGCAPGCRVSGENEGRAGAAYALALGMMLAIRRSRRRPCN